MNILDNIIADKRIEIAEKKKNKTVSELEKGSFFKKETLSFRNFLLRDDRTGIIAEFKKQSPSKGIINSDANVEAVTTSYAKYGASAVSVLTDKKYFGGSLQDLLAATISKVPLLRKDFIIDEYQLIESKAFGAEIILLIAACLSIAEVKFLATFAKKIGLNVLLEIHNEEELGHICDDVDVVGVNNRDLKTFKVDVQRSIDLGNKIPSDKIKISESGIDDVETILLLKSHGFKGFLMGEKFMKEKDPGKAFQDFVKKLEKVSGHSGGGLTPS